ncbi:hypothetical protein FACS1894208_00120 [Clostridia bacterium]|nr:hypothetical protein FACS1894208_00120 [Clostridia bacterium]
MNLYLLTQSERCGYDTYDSCVVVAESEDDAVTIHPKGDNAWWREFSRVWASDPETVHAKYLGVATDGLERGMVLASFNAG